MAEAESSVEEENRRLRAENERLRRLLNDPQRLLQRGLRILAGMGSAELIRHATWQWW